MTPHHRQAVAWALLIALLGGGALWSYGFYREQRAAAAHAASDLADCRRLAGEIRSLRDRPMMAGAEEMQLTELARVIESAAGEAQVPPEALVRVWPEHARRVGETAYQEKPTQVLLRGVTLQQLTTFLCRLGDEETNLRVRQVRLVAPRDDETGSRWTAETTLSYLIYAPRAESAR